MFPWLLSFDEYAVYKHLSSAILSDQFCTIEALLRSRKRLALLRTKIVKSGLLRKTLRLKALISYHSITDKVCRRTFNLKVRKQDYPDEGTNHILWETDLMPAAVLSVQVRIEKRRNKVTFGLFLWHWNVSTLYVKYVVRLCPRSNNIPFYVKTFCFLQPWPYSDWAGLVFYDPGASPSGTPRI